MSFKAIVECDGSGCFREADLDASYPDDAESEFYKLQEKNWLIDLDNYTQYCPECAKKIKEEEEQSND